MIESKIRSGRQWKGQVVDDAVQALVLFMMDAGVGPQDLLATPKLTTELPRTAPTSPVYIPPTVLRANTKTPDNLMGF